MRRIEIHIDESGNPELIIRPEWRPNTVYGYSSASSLGMTTIRVPLSHNEADELQGELRAYLSGAAV